MSSASATTAEVRAPDIGPAGRSTTKPSTEASNQCSAGATAADVAAVLRGAGTAVVCGHVDPDGDALGSLIALTLALRSIGVDAQPSWGSRTPGTPPAPVEPGWSFLSLLDQVVDPAAAHPAPDVVVCCDTAASSRLGTLAPLLDHAGQVVVIDHHVSGSAFGDLRLVDPVASCTGVLVLDVIDALGVSVTPAIADALYLALLTDTGRFGFSSTRAADHRTAARLLEAGADHAGITRAVYDTTSAGYLGLLAAVMGRAQVDGPLVWAWTGQDDLDRSGALDHETDGLMESLRRVGTCDVALLLRQAEDGRWRCSLRSRGGTDVATIAGHLGGGGHRLAAGFTTTGDPADVARTVARMITEAGS